MMPNSSKKLFNPMFQVFRKKTSQKIVAYTQYPIIRNSDQAPLVGFLKKSPISDSRRFLIFQV